MRAAVLRRLRGSRGRLIYRSPSGSNRPMIGPLDGDLIGDVRKCQALISTLVAPCTRPPAKSVINAAESTPGEKDSIPDQIAAA